MTLNAIESNAIQGLRYAKHQLAQGYEVIDTILLDRIPCSLTCAESLALLQDIRQQLLQYCHVSILLPLLIMVDQHIRYLLEH